MVQPKRCYRQNGDALFINQEWVLVRTVDRTPILYDPAAGGWKSALLLRLSKAKADPKAFHHLVGDKAAFDRVVGTDAQKTDDLVELAGRVKRALQSAARNRSADAETEEAAAAADRDAMNGLVDGPCDAAVLQAAHTEAVQRHAMLKTQWDAYWNAPGGG